MKKNLLLLAVIFCSATLMAQTVSRFAGVYKTSGLQFISPSQSFSTAWFYGTGKIVFDKNGNGWVLETTGNRVRMIDAGLASVYNRAGSSAGNSGAKNDPAGSNALFSNPKFDKKMIPASSGEQKNIIPGEGITKGINLYPPV